MQNIDHDSWTPPFTIHSTNCWSLHSTGIPSTVTIISLPLSSYCENDRDPNSLTPMDELVATGFLTHQI